MPALCSLLLPCPLLVCYAFIPIFCFYFGYFINFFSPLCSLSSSSLYSWLHSYLICLYFSYFQNFLSSLFACFSSPCTCCSSVCFPSYSLFLYNDRFFFNTHSHHFPLSSTFLRTFLLILMSVHSLLILLLQTCSSLSCIFFPCSLPPTKIVKKTYGQELPQ